MPRRQPTHLTRDQARHLFTFIKIDENDALWTLLLGCGLRLGEALGLRWSDLDLDRDKPRLSVAQALADIPIDMSTTKKIGRRKGISDTKTESSVAKVPVPLLVVEALRRQRLYVAQLRLAAVVWDQDLNLVFPSQLGTPLDPAKLGRAWRALRVNAELPKVRIHDLRHSAATFLLAAGVEM